LQLDSGLSIVNLLNFIYVPLDIFLTIPHNELTELEAWLYFLASDNPAHIMMITEKYPFFKELYRDIINLRYNPRELITMYSESLLIADRNTVNLMIDEMREENNELKQQNDAMKQQNDALRQELETLKQELERTKATLK